MNHAKNQHYVPQFLLRNFCSTDENQIWCYDKTWNQTKERSISKVAYEEYFYDIVSGQREGSLEYFLGKAESDAAPIVQKIIEAKNLEAITLEEKVVLALFIGLQLNRTKASLKNTERINNDLMQGIKEFANSMNLELNIEEQTPKQIWHSMFNHTPDFSIILMNKLWFLLESDKEFYTSDNPVVKQNILNQSPHRGTLGLNSDGVEIYFPLSDSLLICLFCERSYSELAGIKLALTQENIENINSLQVKFSERFIFSSQNNFELVKDMVDKGEV